MSVRVRADSRGESVIVGPGEVLVVRIAPDISAEAFERFQERLNYAFGGTGIRCIGVAAEQLAVGEVVSDE